MVVNFSQPVVNSMQYLQSFRNGCVYTYHFKTKNIRHVPGDTENNWSQKFALIFFNMYSESDYETHFPSPMIWEDQTMLFMSHLCLFTVHKVVVDPIKLQYNNKYITYISTI